MGRQLSWRALAGAALVAALAGGSAQAQTKGRRAPAADEIPADVSAPQYRVRPCCDLCPKAADPASYTASKYMEDSAVLVQGRDGWLFRTKMDLIQQIGISDLSLNGLRRLVDTLHSIGTELVIVYMPPRGLADADRVSPELRKSYDYRAARQSYIAAMARLRSTGAVVVPMEKVIDEGKGFDYYFRRDHHWTPTGSERTAQLTAQTIRSLPVFRDIPRKQFKTQMSGLIAKPGSIQKMAQQLCGGTYSMQYVPGFATEPAGGEGGGGGLLDEEVSPEITLVGTSNSDDRGGYNFGGYLQQYLEADVLNVAITGGSFEGSLLKYLPSEAFQKNPPKILIWEMPYQDFPGTAISPHRIFRQAVALVGNGCATKPALITKTVNLQQGSNEVLFNGGGRILPVVGASHLIDLQFSDPNIKELQTHIWYLNGMRERLQLRFKQYVDNKGRFVAELRNDREDYANATFMGATIEMPHAPAKPTTVTAKVCLNEHAPGAQPIKVSAQAAEAAVAREAVAPKPAPAKTAKAKPDAKPKPRQDAIEWEVTRP
jgi:alginate biosynthesis protein AlgX